MCKSVFITVLSFPQIPITDFIFHYLWIHIEGIDNDLPYYYNRTVQVTKNQVYSILDVVTTGLHNMGNVQKICNFIEKFPIYVVYLIFPCFSVDEEDDQNFSRKGTKSLVLDEKETITLDRNGKLLRVNFDDVNRDCSSSSGSSGNGKLDSNSTEGDDSLALFYLDTVDDDNDTSFQPGTTIDGVTTRTKRRQQRRPSITAEEDNEDGGDNAAVADSPNRPHVDNQIHPDVEPNPSDFSSSSSSSSSILGEQDDNNNNNNNNKREDYEGEILHLAPELDEDVQSALKESSNRLSRFSLLHPRDSIFKSSSRSTLQRIKANAKLNYQTNKSSSNGTSSSYNDNDSENSYARRTSRLPPLDTGNGGLGYGSLKKKRFMVKKPSSGFY